MAHNLHSATQLSTAVISSITLSPLPTPPPAEIDPMETITLGQPWTTAEPKTFTSLAYRFPSFTSIAYVSYPMQDSSANPICLPPHGNVVAAYVGGLGTGLVIAVVLALGVRLAQGVSRRDEWPIFSWRRKQAIRLDDDHEDDSTPRN